MKRYQVPPIPKSVFRNPLHFIAFGFGSGALPFAPGTFGTLVAIPLYLLLKPLPLVWYVSFTLGFIFFSMWLCEKVSKDIGVEDHQGMCIDEIVGYLVTMTAAPHGPFFVIMGFLFFRLFDIWKPFPINWIDSKIKNGIGMVLDDVLAGIYSAIALHVFTWVLLRFFLPVV